MQNQQIAEILLHPPGRSTERKKLHKKAEKPLTASHLPCILKQYHKNGIERPKGILQNL